MRSIRVTGRGQIRLRPDTTRITMTLTGVRGDYAETLRRSAEETDALKDVIAAFGFARSDLKTLRFGVDAEYESFRDKNGDFAQRFVGYRFEHAAKLEFPSDNGRLGALLRALAGCEAAPEFRISYTVADAEAAKNRLLARAVADAKEKAAVLTQAGGVRLGEIQSIDYSWAQIDLEYRPMGGAIAADKCLAMTDAACCGPDIEPDDIEASDTVTVVWEIG